jgi:hypothetical protein
MVGGPDGQGLTPTVATVRPADRRNEGLNRTSGQG